MSQYERKDIQLTNLQHDALVRAIGKADAEAAKVQEAA